MLIPKELIIKAKEAYGEKATLEIKEHFDIQNWDEKYLKGSCPLGHSDSTPSFIWNPKESSFHCFSCGRNFGIIDLYMLKGMTYLGAVEKLFQLTDTNYKFGEKGVKVQRDFKYPHYDCFEDRSTVESYWSIRGISKETLDYADVQQDFNGNTVFHYYDLNDVLTMVKYRPSKVITKEDKCDKYWKQPDTDKLAILYGINQIDPTKELLIVEGEGDRLACIEAGFKNTVSVPFGAADHSWIETNWDFLEQFEKIIIWSDNDKAGIQMRIDSCARLGSWRTKYVELPETLEKEEKIIKIKDVNEVLFHFGKQAVLDYIANAQEVPVQGVVNLADVAEFDLENAAGLYTHLKPIDKIVYKFLFGSVVILTGKRGSGKSAMLNQLFINESLHQGHDVFCFSGELDAKVLKSWIEINMAGEEHVKMKGDFVHVIEPETKKLIKDWYNERIWIFDDNTNNADKVLEKAIAITRKHGAKIWVLDNLMTLDIGSNDTNVWQKQKDFIVKLVGLAKLYNVLVVLVIHPRKTSANFQSNITGDDLSGSGDLGNMAQYILSVHRYSPEEKNGTKNSKGTGYVAGKEPIDEDVAVDILKNRYTGRLGKAKLFFNYTDYRFFSDLEELYKRFKWNNDKSPLPKKDPRNNMPVDFMKD